MTPNRSYTLLLKPVSESRDSPKHVVSLSSTPKTCSGTVCPRCGDPRQDPGLSPEVPLDQVTKIRTSCLPGPTPDTLSPFLCLLVHVRSLHRIYVLVVSTFCKISTRKYCMDKITTSLTLGLSSRNGL